MCADNLHTKRRECANMLTEREFNFRAAEILQRWRKEADMTQDQMADAMNCVRRTIASIESGMTNLKLYTIYRYAEITHHAIDILSAELNGIKNTDSASKAAAAIIDRISTFTPDEVLGVFFIFFGDHNSNLRAFIHLCSAYLHLPMRDKHILTALIINCYENAIKTGEVSCPDGFHPDLSLLSHAQEKGREAFLSGKDTYHIDINKNNRGFD